MDDSLTAIALADAMLVAWADGAERVPVAAVTSIAEACDVARADMQNRMDELEAGGEPFCPELYEVWGRTQDGYGMVAEIDTVHFQPRPPS